MNNESIQLLTDINCIYTNSPLEIGLLAVGLIASIIVAFFIIKTFRQTNKIHKNLILNDTIKRESELWEKINPKPKKAIGGRIINFYETVSFLIEKGFIEEELARQLFGKELIRSFETYKKSVKKNHKFIKDVYKKWKNQKNDPL